jgi:hypothetical protein
VLLGLACLVCHFVALISEVGLTAQERKALFAADRARELLADSLELLEDGGLSERSWSHDRSIPDVSPVHAARHRAVGPDLDHAARCSVILSMKVGFPRRSTLTARETIWPE